MAPLGPHPFGGWAFDTIADIIYEGGSEVMQTLRGKPTIILKFNYHSYGLDVGNEQHRYSYIILPK